MPFRLRTLFLGIATAYVAIFVTFFAISLWLQYGARTTADLTRRSDRVLVQTQQLAVDLERAGIIDRLGPLPAIVGSNKGDIARQIHELRQLVAGDRGERARLDALARAVAAGRIQPGTWPSQETESSAARAVTLLSDFSADEERLRHLRARHQEAIVSGIGDTIVFGTWFGTILIIVSLAFGQTILTRLARLSYNSKRLASGLAIAPPLRGRDEIAELDRDFHAMAELIASREELSFRFAILAEATRDIMIFARRRDQCIIEANRAASAAFGYTREELLTLRIADLRAPETLESLRGMLADIGQKPLLFETCYRRRDGTTFAAESSVQIIPLAGEDVMVGIIRDISERKHTEAAIARAQALELGREALENEIAERKAGEDKLAYAAFHDALTGLPNRALFIDRLRQTIARQQRYPDQDAAVIFLDLDRFKIVNDSLGHGAGDLLLAAVAQRLETCLRKGDTLARFGGDEFTFLFERVADPSIACEIAQRILDQFALPFSIMDREVFAQASLGIALGRNGAYTAENLVRDADIAMYDAKKRGRARYSLFTPNLLARAIVALEIETDLRRALERGEFRLFYQPIVALCDRRIVGFEALVRWQHPVRGLLAPDAFIGAAEETGLIVPLGAWVLDEACRQLRAWHLADPDTAHLTVSVNVSAKQLAVPCFTQSIVATIAAAGLHTESIAIEITESVIMDDPDVVRVELQWLRAQGVRVHLDDFGTGYSSLAYLHNFPIDVLKIDRSFVSSAGAAIASPAIVGTIVGLAQHLGISVTAEGIETGEQLAHLLELGCARGQGYLFSRPLDAHAAGRSISSSTETKASRAR